MGALARVLIPNLATLSFGRRVGWIFIGNLVSAACGLVTLPLLLHLYPIDAFSVYAGVVSIQQFCVSLAFTATGVGAAATLTNSIDKGQTAAATRDELRYGAAGGVLFVLSLTAFWPYISSGHSIAPYLLAGAVGIPFRLTGVVSAAYRAQGRERALGVALVTTALVRLAVTLACASQRLPLWAVILAASAVDMSVVSFHRIRLGAGLSGRDDASLRNPRFRQASAWMLLVALTDGVVNSLDRIIVGAAVGSEAVGPYHAARRYAAALGTVGDAIYQSLMTDFARIESRARLKRVQRACAQFSARALAVFLPCAALAVLAKPLWAPILLPGATAAAADPMLLMLSGYAIALSLIAVHPALISLGHWRATLGITVLANVAFVISALALGREFGLMGMATAVVAQLGISIGCKCVVLYRAREEQGDT